MKALLAAMTVALWLGSGNLYADFSSYTFDDPAQEEQFKALTEELRCLVCQNQSLADSNAGLAQDLRQEVFEQVQAGNSNADVIDFMVTRYGDFVLYRPPVKSSTYLLWAGPLLLFLGGALTLGLWIRGRSKTTEVPLSQQERERLANLTGKQDPGSQHDD